MFRSDPDQRLSAEIVRARWGTRRVMCGGADRLYEVEEVIRAVHAEPPRRGSTDDAECVLDTRWQYEVASRLRDDALITTLHEDLAFEQQEAVVQVLVYVKRR